MQTPTTIRADRSPSRAAFPTCFSPPNPSTSSPRAGNRRVIAGDGRVTISNRGGGSTTPVAGRLVLTTEQNLFNAGNNLQTDGQVTFRTPGKVITMAFHAAATNVDNTCELHASVLEPHGPLL